MQIFVKALAGSTLALEVRVYASPCAKGERVKQHGTHSCEPKKERADLTLR